MKKLFAMLIILMTIFSCKKEGEYSITQENELVQIRKDSSVKKILVLNKQLLVNMNSSINTILPLIKKKYLTNIEKSTISSTLGFSSIQEYEAFFKEQGELINEIKTRYPILTKSVQLESILLNTLEEKKTTDIKAMLLENRCDSRLNNCMTQANVVYTAEILGCTATAMGVGSLTFGLGGVAFQLVCGGVALEHLSSMRTGCNLDYLDCRQIR